MATKRNSPPRIIRRRFLDQLDADAAAERFLTRGLCHCSDSINASIQWWNLENDDGRLGALTADNRVIATVTIIRDEMNWSLLTGTIFGEFVEGRLMLEDLIERFEAAIVTAVEDDLGSTSSGARLLVLSGEAIGALRYVAAAALPPVSAVPHDK